MIPQADLEEVATDELVAEVMRRHDVCCFFGMKVLTLGNDVLYNRIKGPPVAVLGLVELEKNRISNMLL